MAKKLAGLNRIILGLDGVPLRHTSTNPQVAGELITAKSLLANAVARGQSDNPMRAMEVARKVYGATDQVVLDDQDIGLLQRALKEDRVLNDMAKAEGFAVLEAAEDIDKPLEPPSDAGSGKAKARKGGAK